MLTALQPLLPKNHPVLVTLSLPLSPTFAPLRSVVMLLRDILVALRIRAAPVRDAHIDTLIQALDGPEQLATTEDLARLVVDTARSILELAETMKEDLSQLVLGCMDEQDLKAVINQQAMLREKIVVLQFWPPSGVEVAWKTWLNELDMAAFPGADTTQPTHRRWVYRLVQALGTNSEVISPLSAHPIGGSASPKPPMPEARPAKLPPNSLPPPFLATAPTLHTAQNYLQALVVAACLRSLVRLPPRPTPTDPSAPPTPEDSTHNFMERVWTLLKSFADKEPGAETTRVMNLADEVVRVRRTCANDSQAGSHDSGPDQEEEARLRAAVDRTLQPHDPVFVLLQTRLLRALAAWLVSAPETPGLGAAAGISSPRPSTPVVMQTGRERPGMRPRLHTEDPTASSNGVLAEWERARARPRVIKGFEDEVLVRAVAETFGGVGMAVDWMDGIWRDLIESGEIGGAGVEGAGEGVGDGPGGGLRREMKAQYMG